MKLLVFYMGMGAGMVAASATQQTTNFGLALMGLAGLAYIVSRD